MSEFLESLLGISCSERLRLGDEKLEIGFIEG
jgi:hypothetical protein